MSTSFEIKKDPELKERVRNLTGYEDNEDELPNEQLQGIIDTAKLELSTEFSSTDWYNDQPYTLVLLGTTCILAKSQVENYSVDSWSIGDESISVRDTDPSDSMQFQRWNDLINKGVKNSNVLRESKSSTLKNTSSFIG
jgi:hypothetical protein